jgi:hypothetical protein
MHDVTSRNVAGPRPNEVNFSIYLILSLSLSPGVHSASNINDYQKYKNKVSGEQSVAGATYRHLWADCLDYVRSLTSHNPTGVHGLLRG